MKEYNKTPEKERNKMETVSNLPNAEFQTCVIRLLNELNENFNKELRNLKKEDRFLKGGRTIPFFI